MSILPKGYVRRRVRYSVRTLYLLIQYYKKKKITKYTASQNLIQELFTDYVNIRAHIRIAAKSLHIKNSI